MAATDRISNNRLAAAQQLQLSVKSGITAGSSTDSASSFTQNAYSDGDQVLPV